MRKRKIRHLILPCILLILAVATILFYQNAWGFDRQVSEGEKTLRLEVVHTAESWQEDDGYVPLPGDLIFYHWDCMELGDCSSWSDHVGIVVGTLGPLIKVIEGNKDNDVSYRITMVDAPGIRGYGLPDYESKV